MDIKPGESRLFRICTENVNREGIEAILNKVFPVYTVIMAQGYWNGIREGSLIIEVVTPFDYRVKEVAQKIKELNKQQSVLIQEFKIKDTFV